MNILREVFGGFFFVNKTVYKCGILRQFKVVVRK